MWEQLLYSTIVLTNWNLADPQFYAAPSPFIRAADVVEVYEATQERLAAAGSQDLFTYRETNAISYSVAELAGEYLFDEYTTNTVYAATGSAFKAWNFSMLYFFDNEVIQNQRPPIQGWRLSRAVLNKSVSVINDIAPRYVRTETPLEIYNASNLWTDAGVSNGAAPAFGYMMETGKLWTVWRALKLMNKTWAVPVEIGGSDATWSTNDVADPYTEVSGTQPDWYTNANLIPGWDGAPYVVPRSGVFAFTNLGTTYESARVLGPSRIVLTYDPTTTTYQADARLPAPSGNRIGYDAVLRQGATGAVNVANLGAGVVSHGTIYCSVTGYAVINGAITQGFYAADVSGDAWSLTHTGPTTNWLGQATWAKILPRLSDVYDLSSVSATGAWAALATNDGLWQAAASNRASVDVIMQAVWPTNVIHWQFLSAHD